MEGDGATVRRSIGSPKLRNFTPFLLFDHATVGSEAGFPEHPHRGQETITYCLSGSSDHEDFTGHRGTLTAGDLQFMTAGRGIMHAEMPRESPDGSPGMGIQVWIDLPKALKYVEPRYRYVNVSQVPKVEVDQGRVTVSVILGQSHGEESKQDLTYTPIWYLDITIRPGGRVKQIVPICWNTFAYVLEGISPFWPVMYIPIVSALCTSLSIQSRSHMASTFNPILINFSSFHLIYHVILEHQS